MLDLIERLEKARDRLREGARRSGVFWDAEQCRVLADKIDCATRALHTEEQRDG